MFQPTYRYFKRVAGVGSGDYIYFQKSKELSDKDITALTLSDYTLHPQLSLVLKEEQNIKKAI